MTSPGLRRFSSAGRAIAVCALAAAAASALLSTAQPTAAAPAVVPRAAERQALAAAMPVAGRGALGRRTKSPIPLLAYYYLWFDHSSWSRAKKDYPLMGTYSSSEQSVLRRQIQQAKSAGIDGFIVSWKNTALNDERLRLLMTEAARQHFKLAMIYQGLDFYRRPLAVARIAADFATFRNRFADDPVFYRIDGKPLTIWSGTWAFSHAQVARVTATVRPGMLVLSTEKNAAGFARLADVTDGDAYYWSSVNPATNTFYGLKLDQMSQAAHSRGEYWIAPFAPGFDARLVGGRQVVGRLGGQTLRAEYAAALQSSPDALGLISWNEFSENTEVEPSVRYGFQSLNVLRQLHATSVPPPAGPAAPSEPDARTHVSAAGYVGNLLRLAGFPVALVAAGTILALTRGRAARRRGRARARRRPT